MIHLHRSWANPKELCIVLLSDLLDCCSIYGDQEMEAAQMSINW